MTFQFNWGAASGENKLLPMTDALFTARMDVLKITVMEEGYLKAKKALKLAPKFRREGVISWLIEEGSEVKEGDVLVEFEKTELQKNIDDHENRLLEEETEQKAAEMAKQIQERESEASVETAKMNLEMAKMKQQRYLEGDAPNELRTLNLALAKAKSAFLRAEEQYKEVPTLQEEGFLTKLEAEDRKIDVDEKKNQWETSEKNLELFNKYTYKMEIKQKQADVDNAELSLLNAKEKAQINITAKESRISQRKRQVEATKSRLERYKKERDAMTMKAPQNGIVHYGDTRHSWREDEIKVGGRVWPGMTIITLPDLSDMQVVVFIHEADIDQVKDEMDVDITIEAIKGKTFKGKVSNIASVASSDRSDTGNKTFEVTIDMESDEERFRSGITARAEIKIEEVADSLLVPIHSVFTEGGEHFCFINKDAEVQKRTVEIGKNNTHFVQLLSGIEEGVDVLLYDPRDTGGVGSEEKEGSSNGASPAPSVNGGLTE